MANSKARIRRRVKQYSRKLKRRKQLGEIIAHLQDVFYPVQTIDITPKIGFCTNPYAGNEFDFCHVEPSKPNATLEILMAKMAKI